jgi:two-component system response regulator RegX3
MTYQGFTSARILVMADTDVDQEELVATLVGEGFQVVAERTLDAGLRRLKKSPPDVVLLDIALPKNSCFDICRHIGKITDAPIVVISAEHDQVGVVSTLEHCAADYITKPVRSRELIARLRALLRRTHVESTSSIGPAAFETDFGEPATWVGPIEIDTMSRRVFVHGKAIELSRREFDLLELLASPPGKVRTREEMIDRIWAGVELSDTRPLDKYIRSLRAKLEPRSDRSRYLVTVHGVGFRFSNPDSGPG